jgi:hypothetical protein
MPLRRMGATGSGISNLLAARWFVKDFLVTQRQVEGWSQPVWHRSPVRDEYYYGLFWSGMPDLELGNPAVRAEVQNVARFWLVLPAGRYVAKPLLGGMEQAALRVPNDGRLKGWMPLAELRPFESHVIELSGER